VAGFERPIEEISGQLDIHFAVFDEGLPVPLAEPGYSLQTVGHLGLPQVVFCQVSQAQAKSQNLPNLLQQVESRQLAQLERAVGAEHFVVKADEVEADHQVQVLQSLQQGGDLIFPENLERVGPGLEEHPHGKPHEVFVLPSTHLVCQPLGLDVKKPEAGRGRCLGHMERRGCDGFIGIFGGSGGNGKVPFPQQIF